MKNLGLGWPVCMTYKDNIYYTMYIHVFSAVITLLPSLLDPFTDWRSEVQTCSGNHSSSGLKGSNSKLKRSFCAKRHLSMVNKLVESQRCQRPKNTGADKNTLTLWLVMSGRSSGFNEVVVLNLVWFHQFLDLIEVAFFGNRPVFRYNKHFHT